MTLFSVDADLCKRDGICAAVCPARIIEPGAHGAVPGVVTGGEAFCIGCGQCVAVCPHGALTHTLMGPDDCLPINKGWRLTPEQAEHFLRSRRSIRTYKNKAVDRETLTRLIAVARYAPSGRNLQPVQWLVFHDTNTVRELAGHVVDWMRYMIRELPDMAAAMNMDRLVNAWTAGVDVICRDAPHVVIAHGHKDERTAPTAGTIALTYLDSAAPSFGLGTCWAGYFGAAATLWPPMQTALDLPEDHICLGAMMIGYPRFAFHRMPPRNPPFVEWR